MGIGKGKLDGGQGGKLGHSNQDHWEYTEEVKEAARKRRRLQAKREIVAGLTECENPNQNEFSQQPNQRSELSDN